jgi:hypothetical protein
MDVVGIEHVIKSSETSKEVEKEVEATGNRRWWE